MLPKNLPPEIRKVAMSVAAKSAELVRKFDVVFIFLRKLMVTTR